MFKLPHKSVYRFLSGSLQTKLGLSITLIIAMVLALSTYTTLHIFDRQLLKAISQKINETSKNISDRIVQTNNNGHRTNPRLLIDFMNSFPHKGVHILLCDSSGIIITAKGKNLIGSKLAGLRKNKYKSSEVNIFYRTHNNEEMMIARRPIINKPQCYTCHGRKSKILGAVEVQASLAEFKGQARLMKELMIGSNLVTFIVASIAIVFFMRLMVSRSIISLTKQIRNVEKGNLDIRLSCNRNDEIGLLCKVFNLMIGRLADSMRQLEITHQLELQHADRLVSLGELAAGLAHEIRNPLAGISGAIHVLDKELASDDPNHQVMDEIQNEINRLNNSLSSFLAYSRPAEPEFHKINLHQVIENSLSLCLRGGQFSDIKLIKNYRAGSENIVIDPSLIQQAFINIILNASQAMNHRGELTISTQKLSSKHGQPESFQIEFIDNGPGIPQHIIDKIYRPFFSSKPQGTGLGLAIVKHIITQHNGTIFVSNNKDKGARFTIILPHEQTDKRGNDV